MPFGSNVNNNCGKLLSRRYTTKGHTVRIQFHCAIWITWRWVGASGAVLIPMDSGTNAVWPSCCAGSSRRLTFSYLEPRAVTVSFIENEERMVAPPKGG